MRDRTMVALGIVLVAFMAALTVHVSNALVDMYDDGTHVAQRGGLNLISGAGITVTSADDAANNRVGLTVGVAARSGNAGVAPTETSAAVTHGLGSAPDQVILSPTTDTTGVDWWVSATSSTTFTITVRPSTTTSVGFDWRAMSTEN
tara:strand:+ start:2478 stop:2918 length:441 start_codon:yes stop_codon:yes gene_type:complete